jgi:hypothetical protein
MDVAAPRNQRVSAFHSFACGTAGLAELEFTRRSFSVTLPQASSDGILSIMCFEIPGIFPAARQHD